MNYRVPAIYEKGGLRLLKPLDLPEQTQLTVIVSMPEASEPTTSTSPGFLCPTRSQPLSMLDPLIGTVPAGGDALRDTEALYDEDW